MYVYINVNKYVSCDMCMYVYIVFTYMYEYLYSCIDIFVKKNLLSENTSLCQLIIRAVACEGAGARGQLPPPPRELFKNIIFGRSS